MTSEQALGFYDSLSERGQDIFALTLKFASIMSSSPSSDKVETPASPKTAYDNEGEEYVPCVGQPLSNLKPIPYEQPVFKNGKIYYGD